MKKATVEVLTALLVLLVLIGVGAWYFHRSEAWSYVDSFYFTVMTLTSVGYGDLVPTHDTSKIVTAVYSMVSIPIVVFALGVIAKNYFERRINSIEKKMAEVLSGEKKIEEEVEKVKNK